MERKKIFKQGAFGTLILLLFVLAAATIIEKLFGSELAQTQIYHTWWFVALWVVLAISALAYLFAFRAPCTVHRALFPVHLFLHTSLIIILLGALITYLTGDRGYVHIRQGEIANFYISEGNAEKQSLPFDVKLLLFDIEYHPETDAPADYISFLKVDDEVCRVSMNKIYKQQGYRFYQMDYDSDEMGTTLLVSHDPYGIAVTYSGYILLALSMIWILFLRIGWKRLLFVLVPVAGLWFYISQMNPMTPVLRSPMLAAHVSVIMVAYTLLLVMMVQSIIGLSSRRLRKKMYDWNSLLLYPALFLLAAGIFIGAVWANISWGHYWGWDAKETWALITLMVYALPFHKNSLPFFRDPKKYHRYCIIAFFSILMTFFGVSYFLGGIHSYI
jgi:cytochrome c biogenesis factor